jgi:zinc/manganese transport system permease protein
VLGGVLVFCHKPLRRISEDPERARAEGLHLGRWDFVFYMILGMVVTSSVQVAGVLLVFSLLVVPSVMALRLFPSLKGQFFWVVGVGTTVVIVGSALSYMLDLPTGAAIVCTFGFALGIQILIEGIVRRR